MTTDSEHAAILHRWIGGEVVLADWTEFDAAILRAIDLLEREQASGFEAGGVGDWCPR